MGEETTRNQVRIALLDDHDLFRASLARFLASQPGFELASECSTSDEALKTLNSSPVEIVLLDFDLGPERGKAFITAAREAGYDGKFVIIAGDLDARLAAQALILGASSIFLKSEAPERLVHVIRLVANGEVWVAPKVIQLLANQLTGGDPQSGRTTSLVLGDRERNVLTGILQGLTNKKIGENMGLSESSVKNSVQRLFGKTGVKRRSQLVKVALEGSLGAAETLLTRQSSSGVGAAEA